jgi:hypothetical protein
MGYERHQFEKERRAHKHTHFPDSICDGKVLRESSFPVKKRISIPGELNNSPIKVYDGITRKILDSTPSSHDPFATELCAVIRQHSSAFSPHHLSAALRALTFDMGGCEQVALARRRTAIDLIKTFDTSSCKLTSQDNFNILTNLLVLSVRDAQILKPFMTRAIRDAQYYSGAQISQITKAMVTTYKCSDESTKLLARLCKRAADIFATLDDTTIERLVDHFGDLHCRYTPFVELVTEHILENAPRFSVYHLGKISRGLLLSNSLVPELQAVVAQRVCNLTTPKSISPFSFEDARGITRCIRALETAGWRFSIATLQDYCDAIQDHWQSYDRGQQSRLARDIAPVLFNRDLPLPDVMQPILTEPTYVYRPGIQSSRSFEYAVASALNTAKANFEHSANRLGFELDFLITNTSGRLVNLEVDGDMYHGVLNLETASSAAELEPLGVHTYRDRVLSKAGISVVRISSSIWQPLTEPEQLELLRRLIPDLSGEAESAHDTLNKLPRAS